MSDSNNRNGKVWQLAFWLITIICGVWLVCLTNGVVANDISARDRDERITKTVNIQYSEIVQRLTRIETKIENRK